MKCVTDKVCKSCRQVTVVVIGLAHLLLAACGLILAMLTVLQLSSKYNSYCPNWLESIIGSFQIQILICSSDLSFKLVLVMSTIFASMGLISSALLLRGVTFRRSRCDMEPWIISNGIFLVIAVTIILEVTAMIYYQQDEPDLTSLLLVTLIWSIDLLCWAVVIWDYRSISSKKQEQYQNNLKYIIHVDELPI